MSKAIEIAKISARGGLHLFWGLAISSIISALYVIALARLLSPSEYGLFSVALIAPSMVSIFRDWGVNSAIIKYIAQYRSENKITNVKSILNAGLLFEMISGLFLSLVSFLLSGFLAVNIFQRPHIQLLIQVASFTILADAMIVAVQSIFTGYEKMKLYSITIVCQSIIKTILAPLLIISGFGAFGAILGFTVSSFAAGLIGITILYYFFYRSSKKQDDCDLNVVEAIKTMFKYGLPLSISAIVAGFLSQFYNFLIAIYCTDLLIGNYQVATNFTVLVTFFSTPIVTMLFPAFSKLNWQKEMETLRNVFQFSIKYGALLVTPLVIAIMILSGPAVSTLFGEKYSYAPLYLTLLVINYIYSIFGSLSLGSLINGQGRTDVNLKLTLITTAIGMTLSWFIIPKFGIVGLIVTILTASIPSLILQIWFVKKYFSVTIDWVSSAKILLASTLSGIITFLIISQISLFDWMNLIIGVLIFFTNYLIIAPLIGAISKTDVRNIREILKDLGPISYMFNYPLKIIENLARA